MRLLWVAILAIFSMGVVAAPNQAQKKPEDADAKAVRDWLKKHRPGKRWQIGPKSIAAKYTKSVYGNQRFWYVHSYPPLPPGAFSPQLQDAFRKRLNDYRKNMISMTFRIDKKGNAVPLEKPADFGKGLNPVRKDDDAKVTAAAALSIFGSGRVPPSAVTPAQVRVTRTPKGWNCSVHVRNRFAGSAFFDAAGNLKRLSKTFAGPLPP